MAGSADTPTFTVEVPATNLILAEILSVTSAMRKNQRWANASSSSYARMNSTSTHSSLAIGATTGGKGRSQTGSARHSMAGGDDTGMGLLNAFMALKMELRDVQDLSNLDALTLLNPFLAVIRSPETSGPITATALASIDKFLTYSVLHPDSPSISVAMCQLSSAGTHCKFEASDSVSDEVVLLKILDLLRNALVGRLGSILGDESVCEMMETGLSMCCQMRLSEMLRRSAERTMQSMVASVFSRLRSIPSSDPTPSFDTSDATSSTGGKPPVDPTAKRMTMTAPDPMSDLIPAAAVMEGLEADSLEKKDEEKFNGEIVDEKVPEEKTKLLVAETEVEERDPAEEKDFDSDLASEADVDIPPYGLASIQELLRVLISLLNPLDQQHTDSMRLMALGLLNTAFEVGGNSIGRFANLRGMVGDHLCKYLFQLARSDNLQLLSTSLRVITNIFDTMRPHLKLQQELFLSFLLDRLVLPPSSTAPGTRKADIEAQLDSATWNRDPEALSSKTSNPRLDRSLRGSDTEKERERANSRSEMSGNALEMRELMLEILGQFARGRFALVDVWVNFDCNVEGEDLFERLIKFFSRGVFPREGAGLRQDNSQLVCLDTILELVGHLASRLDQAPSPTSDGPSAADAAASKANKQVLLQGAAEFNLKPKVGLKFLEDHGVIYSDPAMSRAESLARFFKTTPRLDKKLLGDFISRPDQIEVLQEFMRLMVFDGKIICDALRELLEAFRLPGESQQINRIAEVFAEVYFATKPPDIKSQDATYVLTYSVIMLNTDLHSPQVRKRMDIVAYSRNLRGVNDNSDFSPEYLQSIYDSIRKREIVLPEEHQNQVGFEYGWKELLRRARQGRPFALNRTNEFDRGMFAISWKPMVSAMSYAFAKFRDDYMVQRVIAGFNQCAALAARYGMPEVFDYLILSLSRVTGLTQSTRTLDLGSFPSVDVEGQKVTVSPLSVRFGTNVKAQLAAVVLFTIANNNGASIREGWGQIFEICQTLFVHSLLPPPLLAMEDFLSGESVIPLKPKSAPAPREDRRNDGGLLSTLSSYLLAPYGASGEVSGIDFSDEDIETTLSAVDCIGSCRIEELYAQILELDGDALVSPVQILIDMALRMTVDRLRPRASLTNGSAPNSPVIATTSSRHQLPYDPSAVLLLEIVTSIVSKSKGSISDLWPMTFDFLSKLIASANSFSSLFNERVVASLLRLTNVVIKQDELRDSTFLALDTLRSLTPAVLSTVAEPLMAGLSRLFVDNANRIRSQTEWNLIFALFSATMQQEEAAKLSFDLLKRLASGQLGNGLQPDNYAPFLQVLAGFANDTAAPSKSADRSSDEAAFQRGRQIVDILRDTQAAIPQLISTSPLSPPRAWEASWIPLLSAYAQLCLNPSRELRQIAITSLQRTLLAPEILHNTDVDLTIIFERVFFPMLEELLKPQVFRRDPEGMGETRLRASALLCKIFLQYLTQLSERQGMQRMSQLWLKILGYQDRFMHSGRRDQMYEAVPESLKNVLLVMNASGFLLPPHQERTPEQAKLWDVTFERIQPFLPELKGDLFPRPAIPVPFADSAPPLLPQSPTPPTLSKVDANPSPDVDSEIVRETTEANGSSV